MSRHDDFTKQVDLIIGARIAEARIAAGMARKQLAPKLGVTFQQLSKYEKGANRMCPGRLVQCAKALNKPITYFFEGFGVDEKDLPPSYQERLSMEMHRNFVKMPPMMQIAINNLAKIAGRAA